MKQSKTQLPHNVLPGASSRGWQGEVWGGALPPVPWWPPGTHWGSQTGAEAAVSWCQSGGAVPTSTKKVLKNGINIVLYQNEYENFMYLCIIYDLYDFSLYQFYFCKVTDKSQSIL